MKNLDTYKKNLASIFEKYSYRESHRLAQPLLLEMVRDKNILLEIVKENIASLGFFSKKRINPVIAFDIYSDENVSFVAHAWLPLPDFNTDITHQSIHHHGKLLLTSAAAFGTGYESILFKSGYQINKSTGITKMEIEKQYVNCLYNIEFVDEFTPHVVFYPKDFSVTYALWTSNAKTINRGLQKSKYIQKNKELLRKIIKSLGLLNAAGLNVDEYLDFYLKDGKVIALKERIMYPPGTNESFVKSVFYILQKIDFNDFDFLDKIKLTLSKNELSQVEHYTDLLKKGVTIDFDYPPEHLNIAKINIDRGEFKKAFKSF